ncbi:UbiA prenyltransferase family protein [Pseudozobellia thermophila]|uniref:UbiA prenyltransferase family protein n=1 Tax=Pseudozobellia thermophila TaxID=192903 RepID=A0A1M6LSH8_9FLAO|nr:hypothetical protein [Pseudozobellia thermophila]SHJ74140.1 hypothetical protein SAMN04488513_10834 [Pseudozobellia thermophila]
MKWLQRLFDFYLDASIHVAFAVFALVHVAGITLNIPIDRHLAWFLFFGTIVCYNFMKYGVEAEKYILVANRYHKNIQFASFVAFAAASYHAYFLPGRIWAALACLVFLTFLYALPVLPKAGKLRNLGGFKMLVVALVWAGTTVVLPALEWGRVGWWDTGIETLRHFLLVFILLIPFEIRDLVYDSPDLHTLPQRIGIARTKIVGALANMPLFFVVLFKDSIAVFELVAAGILFLGFGFLMFFTQRKQGRYFSSFFVESIPIMLWGVYLVLQYLFNS